jgi:hypothetical protein
MTPPAQKPLTTAGRGADAGAGVAVMMIATTTIKTMTISGKSARFVLQCALVA